MSGKPWLGQLIVVADTRGTSFSESFHLYKDGEIPTRKGKYPVNNYEATNQAH